MSFANVSSALTASSGNISSLTVYQLTATNFAFNFQVSSANISALVASVANLSIVTSYLTATTNLSANNASIATLVANIAGVSALTTSSATAYLLNTSNLSANYVSVTTLAANMADISAVTASSATAYLLNISNLSANNASVAMLFVNTAGVSALTASSATAYLLNTSNLYVDNATVSSLLASTATISTLSAEHANVSTLAIEGTWQLQSSTTLQVKDITNINTGFVYDTYYYPVPRVSSYQVAVSDTVIQDMPSSSFIALVSCAPVTVGSYVQVRVDTEFALAGSGFYEFYLWSSVAQTSSATAYIANGVTGLTHTMTHGFQLSTGQYQVGAPDQFVLFGLCSIPLDTVSSIAQTISSPTVYTFTMMP